MFKRYLIKSKKIDPFYVTNKDKSKINNFNVKFYFFLNKSNN